VTIAIALIVRPASPHPLSVQWVCQGVPALAHDPAPIEVGYRSQAFVSFSSTDVAGGHRGVVLDGVDGQPAWSRRRFSASVWDWSPDRPISGEPYRHVGE
jgi:hypothetical protein